VRVQFLLDDSHRAIHDAEYSKKQHEPSPVQPDRLHVCTKRLVLSGPHPRLHRPLCAAEPRSEPALPHYMSNSGKFRFAFACPGDAEARADVVLDYMQPLSPLLVIMRVAQSRLLNKEGAVVTADELLSGSVPRRPRLTLKLDFRPRATSDIEGGVSWPEAPVAPTTSKLPEPLPFVRVKSDPPSAIEMLDSEKMDGLWKSQDSRRASWLISPSPSTPSYLPRYATSQDDLRVDENSPNSYDHTPTSSPSDTSYPSCNILDPSM